MVAEYQAENQTTTGLTAVLVGGIAGSGKSLLCQTLVNLLGGQHLSQDEVEAKYAGQNVNVKPFHFFLQLVESTAARSSVRYLFIDSKLAKKSTRERISAAVACGFAQRKAREGSAVAEDSDSEDHNGLKLVLLSLCSLTSDSAVDLCATRIVQRSLRHVALIPQVAHERVILEAMRKDVESVTHGEESAFDVFSVLDMTLPATLLVTKALEVLPSLTTRHSTEQVSSAVRVAQNLEKDLIFRWTTLYWMVEVMPHQASMMLTELAPLLSEMYGAKASLSGSHAWQQLEDLHVTVLWTGSNLDAERKLHIFEGQETCFSITSLCCDLNLGLIAVRVSLDNTLMDLCENPDPHITIAKLPGVAAKQSNNMLLRQRNGDTSVLSKVVPVELHVKGVVQRHLSVNSMAMATAALASTLPDNNPLCELGLSVSSKSVDIFATEGPTFALQRLAEVIDTVTKTNQTRTSQPLQHCRWPPRMRGKVWFTIHEQPLSEQSRSMLESLENDGILSSLHVAVCYVYIAENILQKTYPKLLCDLEQRLTGRCLNSLLHAYHCLNSWRPKLASVTGPSTSPSFCIECLGAGEHRQKLEQGLLAVIENKLGWTVSNQTSKTSTLTPLTLRVDVKEDWILLTLPAPATNQVAGGSDGYSKSESTSRNVLNEMTSKESNGHPPVGSAAFTVEEGLMKIDGSFLGGRGHILRSAATYAAVLGKSLSIYNVRAGSVDETGLQQRDIAILEGLQKIAGGKIDGGLVGSLCVSFLSCHTSDLDSSAFNIKTHWALTHAVQAMIPAMLARSAALGGSEVEVCFKGSTNLCCPNKEGGFEILPQIEYVKLVLFPMLRKLFGITVTMDVRRKGFASDGEVWVRVSTFQWPLRCFDLLERGEVATVSGILYSSAGIPRNVLRRFVKGELRKKDAGADVVFKETLGEIPQHYTSQGDLAPGETGERNTTNITATVACGLVLCITTTSGCCFGGDSMGRKGVAAEMVGEEAARQALRGWQRGGCADEHLEDQLVVFMTLAAGTSRLRLGSSSTSRSLHMQTALWLAECFGAAVRFVQDANGTILEIDGIGDDLA